MRAVRQHNIVSVPPVALFPPLPIPAIPAIPAKSLTPLERGSTKSFRSGHEGPARVWYDIVAHEETMGKAACVSLALVTFVAIAGCKKQEEQPPAGYGAPPPQPYPGQQPQPGQPPTQPGYGQDPTQPAPGAAPAPAAPPAGGQMSQPNAMAFPCQTDAQCFTHRCNTQYGKCAWPCQTDADCTPGNKCMAPQCVPAGQ
jgi:hypothetical protein